MVLKLFEEMGKKMMSQGEREKEVDYLRIKMLLPLRMLN
jgi:hypothetical protein